MDILTVVLASIVTFKIPMLSVTYVSFFVRAIEVFLCWLIIVGVINYVFYPDKIKKISGRLLKRLNTRK